MNVSFAFPPRKLSDIGLKACLTISSQAAKILGLSGGGQVGSQKLGQRRVEWSAALHLRNVAALVQYRDLGAWDILCERLAGCERSEVIFATPDDQCWDLD